MQSMVGQAVSGERLCITRLLGRAMTPEVERQKGLWELDNILRSIYILDFIDDSGLRQSVQKALNRGGPTTGCGARSPTSTPENFA